MALLEGSDIPRERNLEIAREDLDGEVLRKAGEVKAQPAAVVGYTVKVAAQNHGRGRDLEVIEALTLALAHVSLPR
jgi:hypothetical protein